MTEHIASWLFTYALHSTVLLAAAWLVTWRLVRSHDVRDVIWKSALVGSLITTTLQAGLGFVPVGGLVSIVGMGVAPAEKHATAPEETSAPTASAEASMQTVPEQVNRAQPFALVAWAVSAGLLLILYGANRLRLFYRL